MKKRTRALAAVAGATALASTAYGVVTQSDGNAVAARASTAATAADRDRHGPRDLSRLAERLGVSEAKLRTALQELREDRGGDRDDRRAEHLAALAKELGVSTSKLEAALKNVAGDRPGGDWRGDRDGDGRRGDRGRGGPGGPGGHHGPIGGARGAAFVTALAKELDVSEAKVKAAFETVRKAHEAEHETRRNAFADALAEKLDISKDKVREVLADMPHGGGRGRP